MTDLSQTAYNVHIRATPVVGTSVSFIAIQELIEGFWDIEEITLSTSAEAWLTRATVFLILVVALPHIGKLRNYFGIENRSKQRKGDSKT